MRQPSRPGGLQILHHNREQLEYRRAGALQDRNTAAFGGGPVADLRSEGRQVRRGAKSGQGSRDLRWQGTARGGGRPIEVTFWEAGKQVTHNPLANRERCPTKLSPELPKQTPEPRPREWLGLAEQEVPQPSHWAAQ